MIKLYRYEHQTSNIVKVAEINTDNLDEAVRQTVTKGNKHWAKDNPNFIWLDDRCHLTDDETFEFDYFRSTNIGDILVKDGVSYVVGINDKVSLLDY